MCECHSGRSSQQSKIRAARFTRAHVTTRPLLPMFSLQMRLFLLLLFSTLFCAVRADFIANLLFSSSEPYDPNTSCSTAPASYSFVAPACSISQVPTVYNSTGYTCINRTSYISSNYPSLDCSGPPNFVSPPTPVPTTWCKPYSGSKYTATTYACLAGDYMKSSPASGSMTLTVNLNTPDQLCPNPNGPVASASLAVQPCTSGRTCRQLGSAFSIITECVTAGEPVPPPSGQPPTSAPA